jgi:multicomponent Na+:H+ antiporter subunit F
MGVNRTSLEAEVITFIIIMIPIYFVSFVLLLVRVFKGPTISDIVLAIDTLSFESIAFMAILSIFFKSLILIPVAILLSLWTYALDVYFATYLEKKEMGD